MKPMQAYFARWNSRGMFFTISALILIGVFFASLIFQGTYTLNERDKVVSLKAYSLQNFVSGLEQDAKKGVFIAGYRALLGAEDAVYSRSNFLNDSKASLLEAVMNGTIDGAVVATMNQSTLPAWYSRMNGEAIKLGIIINFSFDNVTVDQSSPWRVDFALAYSYNLTDLTRTATFHKSSTAMASVNIIGFTDPLYTIMTGNKISMTINQTPYEGNYVSGTDTTNLKRHIDGLYYANSSGGPSFLMRFEGNLSNSSAGIESIARLPDLQAQGIPIYDRSSVDYIYFGNTTPTIYKINNTYEDWFRLDDGHLDKYQAYDLRK